MTILSFLLLIGAFLLGAVLGWLLQFVATRTALMEEKLKTQKLSSELEYCRDGEGELKQLVKAELDRITTELIEQKGRSLTQYHQEQLGSFLHPFKEHLEGFRKRVEEIHTHQTSTQGGLKEQLEQVQRLNQQLSTDAQNLTSALKGNSQQRGAWGEMILARTLELSGLARGREFELQVSTQDRLRPDAVIYLPEGRFVIIDSKVSLVHYQRFCEEEDPKKCQQELQQHLHAVKQHIKSLSQKNYPDLFDGKAPEFTLMFLPIEPAFGAAMNADPTLFEKALEYKIILVSPMSLLATLKTIEHSWKAEKQKKNVLEIARLGGLLHDRFVDFAKTLLLAQQQMSKAVATQEEAIARLSSQKGNLVSTAERLAELGAKVEKRLPSVLREKEGEAE